MRGQAQAEYRGLCSTCNNAPTCVFPRNPDLPVLHCEEFDGAEYQSAEAVGREDSRAAHAATSPGSEDDDSSRHLGLCSNCDERKWCTFSKPKSGVWHCEEYR